MAEAAVSFVLEKLGNLLAQEANFSFGVQNQMDWVEFELLYLQSFLKDADSRRKKGDERVKTWVREVRDVAYEVENLIGIIMANNIERRGQKRGFAGNIVSSAAFPINLYADYNVGKEVERIKSKICEISDRRVRYGILNLHESSNEGSGATDDCLRAQRNLLPHFHDEKEVVGFEDDTEALMRQLLDPENKQLSIISIVGMGGVGKTTLARRVYNRPQVKRHFKTFAWVFVSQVYNVRELLNEVTQKAMGITKEELLKMGEEDVRVKLFGFLQERRYLIVLDDVWKSDAWANMREVFPDVHNGSRVLLTTRNLNVALYADSRIPPHQLRFLNYDESWELFCRKAFPKFSDQTKGCPIALQNLGQQLVRKCGGLPLALVVLGGLLSTKAQTPAAWLRVHKSMDWESTEYDQNCLQTLALSYNDLPNHRLKSCFLYFSAFPEDVKISVNELMRLWVAEGFVPQRQRQTLEETARCYLEELVQRCLIQVADWSRSHGWVKAVRIHDLLRDLCISEASKDGFLNVCGSHINCATNLNSIATHRVVIQGRIDGEQASSLSNLHSLSCFFLVWTPAITQSLTKLQLLRVLDLKGTKGLRTLPKEIMSLIHLRHLGLRQTGIESLPSSAACLYNLQTLDVRGTGIRTLPKEFWNILTLRHVRGGNCPFFGGAVMDPPPRASMLKNLQALGWTKAESWMEKDLTELTKATALRKLEMQVLDSTHSESLIKLLAKLGHLAVLALSVRGSNNKIPAEVLTVFSDQPHLHVMRFYGPLTNRQHLPDSTQFPPNLTQLHLQHSQLEQDPMEILEKLPNLLYLYLQEKSYCGNNMSCSAGGFPSLRYLELSRLQALREWRVEAGAMPGLTVLRFYQCFKLKMLPEGLQHVSTLQQLDVSEMSKKFEDRVQRDVGEDWYKIRHVTSINISSIFHHP